MSRPGFSSQLSTLIDRTVATHTGSLTTLVILFLQPPLVGMILGLGWQKQEATASTYLCMAIAAVYLGCMNAACAIVKERAIFDRERMFCLNIWAYLLAKMVVLGLVSILQMVLLLAAQGYFMHLEPGIGSHLLFLIGLVASAAAATALGLAISAFATSSYMAVILVPVLIIPQIVFSKVVLGASGIDKRIPSIIEKITITKWGFEALETVDGDAEAWIVVRSCFWLMVQLWVFLTAAALKLKLDDR